MRLGNTVIGNFGKSTIEVRLKCIVEATQQLFIVEATQQLFKGPKGRQTLHSQFQPNIQLIFAIKVQKLARGACGCWMGLKGP